MQDNHQGIQQQNIAQYIVVFSLTVAFCIMLYLSRLYNYLLFHSIVEIVTVTIEFGIFIVAWNSRQFTKNIFFLFIGIAYLFVGGIDFLHTLAYNGMNIFPTFTGANLATQLWIAARYLQSISLLFAIVLINRQIQTPPLLTIYTAVVTIITASIFFWKIFPVCYIDGVGLTPFKIISEYIIIGVLTVTGILLYNKQSSFNPKILELLILSIGFTIISELAFTLYIDVFGLFNLIGHYMKLIAFGVMYTAIIHTGIATPVQLMSKKVEEKTIALQQEKKRVEVIINNLSDGILVLDQQGKLSDANSRFKSIFSSIVGYEPKIGFDFSSSNHQLTNTIHTLYQDKTLKFQLIEAEPGLFLQITSIDMGPQHIPTIGAILEFHDITPCIEFENLRHRFVSTASHELRTPITVCLQAFELLRKHEINISSENKTRLMDNVWRNIQLLSELVEDLLLVSRIDEKRVVLQYDPINASQLIETITMQIEARRESKHICVKVNVADNIVFNGDAKQLGQVFRILLDNAIKYSPENSCVTISATDHYQGPYNHQRVDGVFFTVSDSGIGIPEKNIPYLFTRFYRADNAQDQPGTGLGLSIAKDLVNLHHGEIGCESKETKGTSIRVFIPRFHLEATINS